MVKVLTDSKIETIVACGKWQLDQETKPLLTPQTNSDSILRPTIQNLVHFVEVHVGSVQTLSEDFIKKTVLLRVVQSVQDTQVDW